MVHQFDTTSIAMYISAVDAPAICMRWAEVWMTGTIVRPAAGEF